MDWRNKLTAFRCRVLYSAINWPTVGQRRHAGKSAPHFCDIRSRRVWPKFSLLRDNKGHTNRFGYQLGVRYETIHFRECDRTNRLYSCVICRPPQSVSIIGRWRINAKGNKADDRTTRESRNLPVFDNASNGRN